MKKNTIFILLITFGGGIGSWLFYFYTKEKKTILIMPVLLSLYVLFAKEPMFRGVLLVGWKRLVYGIPLLFLCLVLILFF